MSPSPREAPPVASWAKSLGDPRAVPDLDWVASLAGVPSSSAERALAGLRRHEGVLQEIRESHRSGGRRFYAQIRAPLELYALVRLLKPREIVEAGVSSGVSSAQFLLGLRDNRGGTLHSIDLPMVQKAPELAREESVVSVPPGRSSGWAVPAKLRNGWDLRIGPSQELLPKLVRALPRIDLFLHDDLHTPTHLTFELETIRPKLRPRSVVLADNTEWTGLAFDRFAASLGVPVVHRRRSDLVGLRVVAPPRAR